MPPIIDATVSDFGAYEPSLLARLFAWCHTNERSEIWGLLVGVLIGAAAVLMGGDTRPAKPSQHDGNTVRCCLSAVRGDR